MGESSHQSALRSAIQDRSGAVVVLGLGAVGLPLVRVLLEAGFSVVAADTDEERVRALAAGRSPFSHLSDAWLRDFCHHERVAWQRVAPGEPLEAPLPGETPRRLGIICVPTPLDERGDPDLHPLRAAAQTLAHSLLGPSLVVLESTTYPGTTRRLVAPLFEAAGWHVPQASAPAGNRSEPRQAWLAFAPERVDPGRGDPAGLHSPRLVGGLDEGATQSAQALYEALGYRVHTTPRAEIAEAAKLVENVYRAVNIALVNELKVSFAAQGIDIWEVLDAASTKSFGFQRFDPGPGAGGSCIPVDPRYLEFFAREGGVPVRLVELAGRIDRHMVDHVVDQLERALRSTAPQAKDPWQGTAILLLGVAYKPGVSMTTESPSLRLAARLQALGAQVRYHDPHVPGPVAVPGGAAIESVAAPVPWDRFRACVYLTDHPEFDLAEIAAHAPLLLDTRGKSVLAQAGDRYRRA